MRVIISVCILLFVGLVLATPTLAQTFVGGESPTLQRDQTVNGDYFATGDKVVISGTVNGDAYVAGGTVLIDGTINGDLLVAGGNVTIRGSVTQDVRAAGGNITISSDIGGNTTTTGGSVIITDSATLAGSLVAGVGNLELYAPVGKGITIGGGAVQIGNQVGGNIAAGVGELDFTSDARVAGDLTYWSEQKVGLAQGASISGQVTQHIPPHESSETVENAAEGVFAGISIVWKLMSFATSLIIGLLLIKFLPRFTAGTSQIVLNNPLTAGLVGLIALIVVPIMLLLLLVTVLGIPFALLLLMIYVFDLFIAKIFVAYAAGTWLSTRANAKWQSGLLLLAGLLLYYIVTAIPIIGGIMSFATLLVGLGALVMNKRNYYKFLVEKKAV